MPTAENPNNTSSATLIPFSFEGAEVRTLVINDEVFFVGKDVAERLGYADPTNAIKQHCKGVVKRHPLQTAGGLQQVRILAEPDVLRLIVSSNLPSAQRFERLVFEEILPSIRKHGGYMVAAPEETPEQLALRALTVLQATVERQKAQLAVAEPKAEALDRISASGDSLTMTQTAKILGMKQSDMKKWMHANRWAYPQNDSWLAYEHQIKAGRLEYKEAHYTDKETRDRHRKPYCHVTPKGLAALALLIPAKLRTEMRAAPPYLTGLNDALRGRLQ